MPDDCPRPPMLCRFLVRLASWIVPGRRRAEWRARWDSGLWNWWILVQRGELAGSILTQALRHGRTALTEAFFLRLSKEQLRQSVRGPAFVLACAAAALLLTAIFSRGFTATRALLEPLPVKDPGSLISLRYTGAVSDPSGVPARLVPVWRQKSALLSDLAGYRHRDWYEPRAWVTTNFFSLMGTQAVAGRTFRPGDTDVAVLSGKAWRTMFGGDPRVIGSTIPVEGRPYTVVGVLPEAFWAISSAIAIWTPLVLEPEPASDVPFLIGAVGRLKPGAAVPDLRRELVEAAKSANYRLPRPPQVTSFHAIPGRALFGYLFGILFALVIGAALVVIGRPSLHRFGWRYWSFFVVKTVSVVVILSLLWIEVGAAARARMPDTAFRVLLTGLGFTLAFLVACGRALWWSFADQRRRCPVCLQRLAMPVTIGSWASVFEPVTTELLCGLGHGSLCVPETEGGEPDRWTSLDPSWRELFGGKPR